MEDWQEENLVLKMTGLAEVVGGNHLKNPTSGGNSTAVLQEYLGQLSCEQLSGLYRRYFPDFTFFQYTMDNIYPWAQGGRGCHS